jgi:hypothetical protein
MCALGACATRPLTLTVPRDVIATVSRPRYTGWQIDHCANEPPDVELGCVSIGGDIYKVLLLDVRMAGGQKIARTLIIGFPAHALRHDYRARLRLHLVQASDDLRKDTGIEYMASHWE